MAYRNTKVVGNGSFGVVFRADFLPTASNGDDAMGEEAEGEFSTIREPSTFAVKKMKLDPRYRVSLNTRAQVHR